MKPEQYTIFKKRVGWGSGKEQGRAFGNHVYEEPSTYPIILVQRIP